VLLSDTSKISILCMSRNNMIYGTWFFRPFAVHAKILNDVAVTLLVYLCLWLAFFVSICLDWVTGWKCFWNHWGRLLIESLCPYSYDYYCLLHQWVLLPLSECSLLCCSACYCWLVAVVWLRLFLHCSGGHIGNCFCFLLVLGHGRPCSLCSLQGISRYKQWVWNGVHSALVRRRSYLTEK
jgi:hypothetical protein